MTDLTQIQAGTPNVGQPGTAQSFVDKVALPALAELNSAYADATRRKEAADKARQAEQDAANAELSLMASGGELPADIKQQSVAWQMSAMFQKGRAIAIEETNKIEQEFNQSPEAFLQKYGSMTNAFQQMAERWKPQIEQDEYAQKGFVESLTQKQQALSQMESRFVMQKQQETAVNDVQTNLAAAFDTVLRQPIVAPSQQQPATAPPVAAKSSTASGKSVATGDLNSAVSFFESKGWTREQAIGIVANLKEESGLNPNPKGWNDGGKAYGVAQWHGDRQANFKKVFGKPIQESTLEEQLAFVHHELTQGTEQAAGNRLRSTKDHATAAAIVSQFYERPAAVEDAKRGRAKIAESIASSLGVSHGTVATESTSAPPTATPTTITSAPISPDQIEALKKNIEAQGFVHPQGSNAAHEIAANALLQMAVQHNRPEVLTPEFFNQLGIGNQYGGKLPQVLAAQGQINRNADIERNAQLKQQEEQLKLNGTLFADSVQRIAKDDFVNLTQADADDLQAKAVRQLELGAIPRDLFLEISSQLINKIERQKKAEIKTQVQQQKQQIASSKKEIRAKLNAYIESLRQGKPRDKTGVVNGIEGFIKLSAESAEPIHQRDAAEVSGLINVAFQQQLLTEPEARGYIQQINQRVSQTESDIDKEIAKQEKEQRKASAQESLRKSINNALSNATPSEDIFRSVSNAYTTSELSEKDRKDIVEEIFNGMQDFGIDANGNLAANNPVAIVPTGLTKELAGKSLQVFAATGVTPDKYKFFSGQLAALTGDLGNKKFADVMPRLDAYTRLIANIESKNPVTFDNLLKGLDGKSSESIYQLNKDLLQTGTPPETRFNLLFQLKQNQEIYDKSLSQMNATESQKFMEFSRLASSELKDLEKAGYKQFIDAVIPAFASKKSVKPSLARWGVGFLTDSRVDFVDGLPDAAMSYAKRVSALKASGVRGAAELAAKAIATEYEAVLVPNISYREGRPAPIDAWALKDIKPTEDRTVSSGDLFAKAILIPASALNRPVAVQFMGNKAMASSTTANELSKVIEAKKKEIVLSIAKRVKNGEAISPNEQRVLENPNLIEVRYLKGTNTLHIKHPNE